ncbi:MAG: tail protein X [Campylobacteraceae bacterium]|jgi:phage tail protein X|nr:tail protein X [Campylobacteraceae bacterium]
MYKYTAHKGERLDVIVYKYYGTLANFEQVLQLNARLKPILEDKDVVLLPSIPKQTLKESTLW